MGMLGAAVCAVGVFSAAGKLSRTRSGGRYWMRLLTVPKPNNSAKSAENETGQTSRNSTAAQSKYVSTRGVRRNKGRKSSTTAITAEAVRLMLRIC